VIRATTQNVAKAIRREDLGTFAVGAAGDATILEMRNETVEHVDVVGQVVRSDEQLASSGMVIAGEWWPDPQDA